MRFASVVFLGLGALVAASPSGDALTEGMKKIKAQVEALDKTIGAYQGGPGTEVIAASDAILATTTSFKTVVDGLPPLDINDAAVLPAVVEDLTKSLQKTMTDLIGKKQLGVAAGLGPKIASTLNDQFTAASALANSIKGKVPATLKAVAEELSQGIVAEIQKGIDAFKDVATGGPAKGAGAGAGAAGPAAGMAGMDMTLSPAGGSITISGGAPGTGSAGSYSSSGSAGSAAGSGSGYSSTSVTGAKTSSPAVYTGAGASIKPAAFGLVAVAAAVFAL